MPYVNWPDHDQVALGFNGQALNAGVVVAVAVNLKLKIVAIRSQRIDAPSSPSPAVQGLGASRRIGVEALTVGVSRNNADAGPVYGPTSPDNDFWPEWCVSFGTNSGVPTVWMGDTLTGGLVRTT
jgi:hypothetical protein